jgi:hypothetical protein
MIWDTSIWRRGCSNHSKIRSAQKCYPCSRYELSPMSPGRTEGIWSREWELNPRPADYEMSCFLPSLLFSVSRVRRLSPPFAPFRQAIVQRKVQRASLPVPMERDIGLCKKGKLSTREAAKKLGVTTLTLQRHVTAKTVDAPPLEKVGGVSVRLWAARDIEKARKILADIRPREKEESQITGQSRFALPCPLLLR